MKVLLVNPEYPTTFWSFKHALRFVSKKAACPPLGLLTIAGMLPGNWDLRLVDMNAVRLKDKDIEQADYVMITGMLIQRTSVLDVIDRCRRLNTKTIAGGPLFTSSPEVFEHLVDHLVLNEAELTLPLFLEDLERGAPQKIYRTDAFPNLEATPVPRWDLINSRHYQTLMIQGSRGCPFDCEFCDITSLFGRRPRVKRPEQIIAELEAIYSLKWRGPLFFVDDNFIGNKKAVKNILVQMIEWMKDHQYPFRFTTEASVNVADDDELMELMAEAGFDTLFIGFETPDETSLKACGKNQNCGRDLLGSIRKLQSAGFQVLGGYIVGFDNDDKDIFARQIRFIQESGVVAAMVGLLNAAPNTRLWNRLKEEKRLLFSSTGDNTSGSINFIPNMDMDVLVDGYRQIVQTIYSPRHLYQRICTFLKEYHPRRRQRIRPADIKALLKSIILLGILGRGGPPWYFWKLFFKTATVYRGSFAEAMTLMVYGHHFRRVAKSV